jgi:hypothetical protein
MEDMADMLIDSDFDDWSYSEPKILKCKSCKKPSLIWRKFDDRWVMMEKDGSPHTCKGYSPPIEVFKELADEMRLSIKKKEMWTLMDKAKKRGGIQRMSNIIGDEQLVDLYACFIRDDQRNKDNPDVGMSFGYKNEINLLKAEILKRLHKNIT